MVCGAKSLILVAGFLAQSAAPPGATLESKLRAERAEALAREAQAAGDPVRGAITFYQPYLACTKCHAAGEDVRRPLGPDLARPEEGTTPAQLVESLLEPSKVIRKGFEPVRVILNDGKVLTGLVEKQNADQVVFRDAGRDGQTLTISRDQIDELSQSKTSIMPDGLVNQLAGRQQFLDLAAYLIEIAAKGPARALELRPPPALYALPPIPEYEQHVDHAGLIGDLDAESFQRGEAIYKRVCANCHGTHEQPGSLPTSLRFASGKFKNGCDPYALYQTLTRGFGLMVAQSWMVPQQKYDVIHYIREAYLAPHNPSQYASIDAAYLRGLPRGDTRGPAASQIEPWIAMDYGPSLINTYEIGTDGSNFAMKGIAMRLDPGPGGVSRGRDWMVFDHDTLRLAAAWSARPGTEESPFIDWQWVQFDGQHQVHPHLSGDVAFSNLSGPGWANPETGSFDDPRPRGRNDRPYGPLPRSWAHYRGTYACGSQTIVSYTVGETPILEMCGLVVPPSGGGREAGDVKRGPAEGGATHGGTTRAPVYTRTFNLGRRQKELSLLVATCSERETKLMVLPAKPEGPAGDVAVLSGVRPAKSGAPVHSPWILLAGIIGPPARTAWSLGTDGRLLLKIPAGEKPLEFTLWQARVSRHDQARELARDVSKTLEAPADLTKLMRGGPRRWPARLTTQVVTQENGGPFAVDVLTHPADNPWLAQMRLTGLDFFDDGDRAAVCTWDGDVWVIAGLGAKPQATLSWQRIASGLFQPLGLKIVGGRIFVTCRDQLAILNDLNGDGETDFYECFNSDHQVTEHFHEFAMGLQTDREGNFYYAKSARHALRALVPHHGTLLRISADGLRTDILATGFRAANGVCLNPDGTFIVTDQEGHWNPKNRINHVRVGGFYGNMFGYHDVTDESDSAMEQPVCWITNSFDRSPAELLWVTGDRWGPMEGKLLNLSYGYGKIYVVPHEEVDGRWQGGMCELPVPAFPTGIMRGRFHPRDGQLYVCGMYAWAGSVTQPGGFYRVRYTGRPLAVPASLSARRKGVTIGFTERLERAAATDAARYAVKVWDLKRTANYGSEHFNERPLAVKSAELSEDGRTVLLEIPDIAPTWCMEIKYALKSAEGQPVNGTIHNTIHHLSE